MTIINRFITKKFTGWTIFFLLCFILLYVIIDLFEHLDDFLQININFQAVLKYYLLSIPPIFVQVLPIAILLSALFVLGFMCRYNEITALKACGVSLYRLILPFIKATLVFCLAAFLINELLVPVSFTKLIAKEKNWTGQKSSDILHDLTFYGSQRRFYYIRSFNYKDKSMEKILVLEYYPDRIIKTRIDAEAGIWKEGSWIFKDGIIRYFDQKRVMLKEDFFKERKMHYKESPDDFLRQQKKLETMNLITLLKYITYLKRIGFHPRRELVELQYRFAFPLTSFFIILLGIPLALKTRRSNILYGAGIALALCLLYYACMSLGLALGKQKGLHPFFSAWSTNILFGGLGLYLLKRSPK